MTTRKLLGGGPGALAATTLWVALAAAPASALVLADKSPELKFRADVGKQTAGYLACIIKASLACEKTGVLTAGECNLVTKTAAAPADPKGKFGPALDKCAAKVDLAKKAKGLTYEDIGCPGDCDPGTPGAQRCTDLLAYQAFTVGDTGTRASVSLQSSVLPVLTGCSDNASCNVEAKRYGDWALGALKCSGACEADYKNKKGNGGPTDGPVCHIPTATDTNATDPVFLTCISKLQAKIEKKGGPLVASLKDAISTALNTAVDQSQNIPGGNCGP